MGLSDYLKKSHDLRRKEEETLKGRRLRKRLLPSTYNREDTKIQFLFYVSGLHH